VIGAAKHRPAGMLVGAQGKRKAVALRLQGATAKSSGHDRQACRLETLMA